MENKIKSHFSINADKYILSLALFISGVLIGFAFVYYMNETQLSELKNYIMSYINSFSFEASESKKLFFNLVKKSSFIFLISWLFSFNNIGKFWAFSFIFIKGFIFGFTSCVFIEQYLIKGLLFDIYVLFPPLIFEISAISFLCTCLCAFSNANLDNANIKAIGAISVIVLISTFIYSVGLAYEAYISPNLIINIAENMV